MHSIAFIERPIKRLNCTSPGRFKAEARAQLLLAQRAEAKRKKQEEDELAAKEYIPSLVVPDGISDRPQVVNPASMPNYLGSARAATGRTARKKGQEVAKLFDLLDLDGDGELTRDEVVTSYEQLNMTEKEAGDFFDSLDPDRKGVLSRTEWDNRTAGLKDFVHAGRTVGSRDAEEKRRLVAFEAKMREDHIHEMKSGKAKSGVSDRPEFTAPGSMPNYLSSASGKLSPKDMKKFTHTGKGLAEREARQKAIVDEVERKAKEGDLAEKRNSNRPEFTNAANMPNYLGSARAATGRAGRRTGGSPLDLLDLDGDGELTRDEVVTSYEQLNMTEKEAGDFLSLDPDRRVLSRTNGTTARRAWNFVHAGNHEAARRGRRNRGREGRGAVQLVRAWRCQRRPGTCRRESAPSLKSTRAKVCAIAMPKRRRDSTRRRSGSVKRPSNVETQKRRLSIICHRVRRKSCKSPLTRANPSRIETRKRPQNTRSRLNSGRDQWRSTTAAMTNLTTVLWISSMTRAISGLIYLGTGWAHSRALRARVKARSILLAPSRHAPAPPAAHEAPAAMAVGALGRHRRTLLDRDPPDPPDGHR